ncbi:RsmD family RNA methyltransferase [Arcanobacterium hippocoleae]
MQNARKLNLPVKVASQKVATYLCNTVPVTKFDLVFIDPPYDLDESALTEVLAGLELHLKDDAMVIVERAKRTPEPNWPDFLRLDDERSWGIREFGRQLIPLLLRSESEKSRN